jgi:hypothetical protein
LNDSTPPSRAADHTLKFEAMEFDESELYDGPTVQGDMSEEEEAQRRQGPGARKRTSGTQLGAQSSAQLGMPPPGQGKASP